MIRRKEEKLFIFAVITYNHGKYIIEHLESIKFQILKHGLGYKFKLVLADDGSKDNTIAIVNLWLSKNSNLFSEVIIEADGVNRGTCINYTNLWSHINSDHFKITAGDDVYSFLNLIKEAANLKNNDFISGLPLLLVDGEIQKSNSTIFHMIATDVIYKDKSFMNRMKQISVINTPSLFYNSKFVRDIKLLNFIREFRVTEDFPMMARIAETYKNIKFKQADQVYVYYRRTTGSTYLVRGSDFDKDKLQIFNHLLSVEKSFFGKMLLKNRMACYFSNNKFFKRLLNFNYYIYMFKIFINFKEVIINYFNVKINVKLHQAHYYHLKNESQKYENNGI